ncbi:MAG: proteasome assembly chaperone family protein [Candidatus Diapherotrites archaeon]|nr:proteasome assembly chaperone family protein [Candidatus Diapherotrites archaeon]
MPKSVTNVKVVEFGSIKTLRNYTLLEGFPGPGLVGTICSKHLVEKMGFKKFGYIHSNVFVPVIRIREGKPVYPSRIFIHEKARLVVILSEQLIPNEFMADFTNAIVEWIRKKKFRTVISLNGLTTQLPGNGKIFGYGSSDGALQFLRQNRVEVIDEGITSGVNALMMLELKNVPSTQGVSLLVPVNLTADFHAAARLVSKLNEMLKLKLEVKTLLEEAEKVKKELSRYVDTIKTEQEKATANPAGTQIPIYT